jgi:glycosyltransferase involved in cell wall biosynthesis
MMEGLVTALMPVKDYHRGYLRKALDSLLEQTRSDWRLLIIAEDTERDSLADVLRQDLRDPRIALIANEGRKLSGAFNTGMRHARTEFVAILFGDDMWSRDAVAVLTESIRRHPEADFFHSSRMVVDEDDRPLSSVHPSAANMTLEDFTRFSPVKHLLCWRRELALSFGGMDETLNSVGPDDYDFPWTMAENGAVFRAIPDCLYLYRDHRDSFRLTTHLPRSVHVREMRRIMKKHGVSRMKIERRVLAARRSYLRQCLYRSPLDRWVKQKAGLDPRRGWRESYR